MPGMPPYGFGGWLSTWNAAESDRAWDMLEDAVNDCDSVLRACGRVSATMNESQKRADVGGRDLQFARPGFVGERTVDTLCERVPTATH